MPAPEQIVFPAVQVLGIEHVDPRTDDLVPLDRRDVVAEEVDPVTADHGDALELVVGGERREFPDSRPGTGGIVRSGSRKLIQQRADSLGHFRPRSPLDAVDGDDLERRGIAAHDDGDGVVALLGPVDADAVPRPGRIRPGPLGGGSWLAAPGVFEIARGDVCAERGVEHPLHGGRVDGASFGTGFLEFVLDGPHRARQLSLLPHDLVRGQPPVGCECFPIAPLVDGPAQVGRPAPHGRDRAIGMLMGGAHHGLCPHAVAVHGLALGGFQNPELHLVDLVEQQARGVGPAHGGL